MEHRTHIQSVCQAACPLELPRATRYATHRYQVKNLVTHSVSVIREGVGFFVSLDALFRYPLPAVIYYRGSAPVRRVPFFACPKQGTERKGTPDSAPRMYTPHAGFPRSALVSDGPRKGHPWPWPGRARSISRPFGRVLRLRTSLGLSKGDHKKPKPHIQARSSSALGARLDQGG